MRIREASVDDAPAIARVTVDTWKTAYRGIINDEYLNNLTYEEREKGWRQFPFNDSFVYVAEDEAQNIIGFAAAGPEREGTPHFWGEIYAIYIYQEKQNKGVGKALFLSVLKKLDQSGINSLMLWVLADSPYRRFYEKLGGHVVESKLLEMEGFSNQITAYGWPNIEAVLRPVEKGEKMVIRRENTDDFSAIYDLVKVAFQTAKVSDGKEQDFVNRLRSSVNYIPELALVAEEDGKLIGHLMLTSTYIMKDYDKFEVLLLAPVSIALEYRNKGVGSSLIKESFRLARELGFTSVFLVGDPAYYCRFGFKTAASFSISNLNNIPDEYIMACELVPDALNGISGTIKFATS